MKKDAVSEFLESIGDEVEMTEEGKYRFVVTGMEFPTTASLETLKAHYNGRAMKRARVQRANEQYDLTQHLPHIVPHKFMNAEKFLFCYLTNKTLPRNSAVVKRHVNGKRFKLRLKESMERKAELDRVKEKRKAKAEKARLARKGKSAANGENAMDVERAKGAEGGKNAAAENGVAGEGEALMEDTLAAALADSDGASGEASEGSDADEGEGGEKVGGDEMEEDGDESDEKFWTRGPGGGKKVKKSAKKAGGEDDGASDGSDEWAVKKPKARKGGARAAGSGAKGVGVGSKRKKAPALPKKVRQGRRRRNSGDSSTAGG